MRSDGHRIDDYNPATSALLRTEAVRLLRGLGFMAEHLTLIGGIVPGMLVLDPAGSHAHIGTSDLDLCLSVALAEGRTGQYEVAESALRDLGFVPAALDGSARILYPAWRWRRESDGVPVVVEFLCPLTGDRPAGHVVGEQQLATTSLGERLGALVLTDGALISHDRVEVDTTVVLDDGELTYPLPVAGYASFLATKATALQRRNKRKDAYDVVWLLEAHPDGPEGVAAEVRRSKIWRDPSLRSSLEQPYRVLKEQFDTTTSNGAGAYSMFLAADGTERERAHLRSRSVGAVRILCGELQI